MKNNLRLRLWEETSGRCVYCGHPVTLEGMEADHIMPWIEGGKTVAENCQLLCVEHNRRKSSK